MQAQEALPFLERKVTHEFHDVSIGDALKEIETMHKGLVFVYSSSTFNMEKKVSGRFEEEKLVDVLEVIFENEEVEFQEKKGKIIIRQKRKGAQSKAHSVSITQQLPTQKTQHPRRRRRLVRNAKTDTTFKEKDNTQVRQPSSDDKAEEIRRDEVLSIKESETAQATATIEAELPIVVVDTVSKVENYLPLVRQQWPIPQYRIPNGFELSGADSSLLESKKIKKTLAKMKRDKARSERQQERLNEQKKFRAYVSSYTGFTQVGDRGGIQMGGSLVWLKNKRWGFGLAGYAIQNSLQNDAVLSADYRLAGGYGGLFMEYTLNPAKQIHFSFPLTVGGGGLAYKQDIDRSLNLAEPIIEASKAFFVVETAANVEMNVIKYLRVGLGLGYRYTTNTTLLYNENPGEIIGGAALSGFTFGVTVKVGIF